jgi:hypothetical protein
VSKIHPDILALSAKYLPSIKIELKDGVAVPEIPATLFQDNLTPEDAAAVAQADQVKAKVYPAFTHAFSQASEDFLKKHKKVDEVGGELKLGGKDTWSVNYKRTETFRNPGSTADAPLPDIVKHGVVTTKLTTQDARAKVGQLKAVMDEIGASALAAFGK